MVARNLLRTFHAPNKKAEELVALKKKVLIPVVVLLLVALLSGFLYANRTRNFESAQRECRRILSLHQSDLEAAAQEALTESSCSTGQCCGYYFSINKESGVVRFEIDGQGMLGGQYWDLVYSADGGDILMTVVDGKVCYENGEWPGLDSEKIFAEVERSRQRILKALV